MFSSINSFAHGCATGYGYISKKIDQGLQYLPGPATEFLAKTANNLVNPVYIDENSRMSLVALKDKVSQLRQLHTEKLTIFNKASATYTKESNSYYLDNEKLTKCSEAIVSVGAELKNVQIELDNAKKDLEFAERSATLGNFVKLATPINLVAPGAGFTWNAACQAGIASNTINNTEMSTMKKSANVAAQVGMFIGFNYILPAVKPMVDPLISSVTPYAKMMGVAAASAIVGYDLYKKSSNEISAAIGEGINEGLGSLRI